MWVPGIQGFTVPQDIQNRDHSLDAKSNCCPRGTGLNTSSSFWEKRILKPSYLAIFSLLQNTEQTFWQRKYE